MRRAGRVAIEAAVAIAIIAVPLVVGFFGGRDYERITALRAEPSASIITVGPKAAAARLYPKCPRPEGSRQKPVGSGRAR